jgi:hypothetical protein
MIVILSPQGEESTQNQYGGFFGRLAKGGLPQNDKKSKAQKEEIKRKRTQEKFKKEEVKKWHQWMKR